MDTENVVATKQDRKYKTLVTDIGKEKMTNAILNGKKVNVVMAAVGDGCGSYYLPTADMTALRTSLSQIRSRRASSYVFRTASSQRAYASGLYISTAAFTDGIYVSFIAFFTLSFCASSVPSLKTKYANVVDVFEVSSEATYESNIPIISSVIPNVKMRRSSAYSSSL